MQPGTHSCQRYSAFKTKRTIVLNRERKFFSSFFLFLSPPSVPVLGTDEAGNSSGDRTGVIEGLGK